MGELVFAGMITFGFASSRADFEQILDLQRRYHVDTLAADVQAREGFVFARHSLPSLQRLASVLPQAIAVADGAVVGYCLAMARSLRDEVPSLEPMFDQFERCTYRDRPLAAFRFFVGGQVCVDRDWRGHGILARLYEHLRRATVATHEVCVTEIAVRNQVSIRAHKRMGFETIATYADRREQWEIVAWDLAHPAIQAAGERP